MKNYLIPVILLIIMIITATAFMFGIKLIEINQLESGIILVIISIICFAQSMLIWKMNEN